MDIKAYLREKRELIDSYLKSYFDTIFEPSILHRSITYSLFAGGKRVRPILAFASHEACGGKSKNIIPQAAALELIHTYSLIHDDLPAMDNDDLRRGKRTNHKVFGEAMAILAGDALLTEAFYMMVKKNTDFTIIKPTTLIKVIREVAIAAGIHGMVGGQAQDIISENDKPDEDKVQFIHKHKTAALITASVKIGALLANADKMQIKAITDYGTNLGLAFQIIDDILDIEGTTDTLGKTAGSDIKKKKMTYPAVLGITGSRNRAKDLITTAIDSLSIFSHKADILRKLAIYLYERKA
ncbi:MAG: polyprenyl synthetase family protein [Nitrospirae bacterium]|nr:polyprenyl synthetase family protein [Nitrospirota bacterium]